MSLAAINQAVVTMDMSEPWQPLLGHCITFHKGATELCNSGKKARRGNTSSYYSTHFKSFSENQLIIRYIINHLKVSKIYHYLHSVDKNSENGRFNLGDFILDYPGEVLEVKGPDNP